MGYGCIRLDTGGTIVGSAVMYIVLMFVIGLIAHRIAVTILSIGNIFKDFRLDDSDDIA